MKPSSIIINLFIILTLFCSAYSQVTKAQKQQWIQNLSSENPDTVYNALADISLNKVVEAIPALEVNSYKQIELMNRMFFLELLARFKSPNASTIIKGFMDSIAYYIKLVHRRGTYDYYSFSDTINIKLDCAWLLFDVGDYTYIQLLLDDIQSSKPRPGNELSWVKIYNEMPQYAHIVKPIILAYINDTTKASGSRLLYEIEKKQGSAFFPDMLVLTRNCLDPYIRWGVLFDLVRMGYPDIVELLKERFLNDTFTTMKDVIADTLIIKYGSFDTYVFIKNNLTKVFDTLKASIRVKWIRENLNEFIPFKPSESSTTGGLLDSLIILLGNVKSQNWLGNQSYVTELNGYISSAKNKLIVGDSINCARQIKTFQQSIDKEYHDTLNTTSNFVTKEGWKFLYYNAQYILDRLPQIPPSGCNVKLINSIGTKLTSGTLQYYEGSWKDAVNNNDGTFFVNTTAKTLSLRMTYEYGTQTKSNVSIGNDTIVFQTVNAQIQLQNSSGGLMDTGSVQYYAGAWRTLGTTTNGIAIKELLPANYSFRMSYAYATKDKQQDIGINATVIFQTVNASIQLQNSQGVLIDQGTVLYYSGAWRDLGITTNGVANKELLPNNYSFRMSYAYASKDKQQDIGTNATVVFQTVNAAVQLQNSQGSLIDQGTVQYYSGAWRDLGITTNGVANKELLPNNYSFRMTYAYASKDKQQDVGTNPIVIFQTVNAAVQLQNSQGSLIDQGTVQYYSGAWRDLGTTTNGIANKELLPNNYSFRMTYAYASKDKQQDISTNAIVVFQTVNAAVQLQNSQGSLIDQGTVQYYSGAWRTLGTTTNGIVTKDLLPNTYSFRLTYEYVSLDKSQDISTNNTVNFSTVLCTIRVKNGQNQLVNNAMTSYYSGSWRQIGNTVNGVITKELLPVNLSFRVKYGTQQQDKQQNLSTNTVVEFGIQ